MNPSATIGVELRIKKALTSAFFPYTTAVAYEGDLLKIHVKAPMSLTLGMVARDINLIMSMSGACIGLSYEVSLSPPKRVVMKYTPN